MWRPKADVGNHPKPPYSLRQGHQLDPELVDKLTYSFWGFCLCLVRLELQVSYYTYLLFMQVSADLNSGPQTCVTSILIAKPSFQTRHKFKGIE